MTMRSFPSTSRTIETPLVTPDGMALAVTIAERWCAKPTWRGGPVKEFKHLFDACAYARHAAAARAATVGASATVMIHLIPRTNLAVRWMITSLREDFAVSRITVTSF